MRKIIDVNSLAFKGFGEVYLSEIASGERKGWKRHNEMHMTLYVISGKIRFVFKEDFKDEKVYFTKLLTETDSCLLSVSPGLWFMFEGLARSKSILLNFSNIPHSDSEVDRCDL